jgi:hypothetical protein
MNELTSSDDDGIAHCARCGAVAAGPCARCHLPMCGDCVVLTEGGADVWAVCHSCARRDGVSLRKGWFVVLRWLLVPILALWVLIELVEHLAALKPPH